MDTVIEHSTKVTIKKDRKWWIIFAMSTSLSLTYLDQTGVALTLVSIQNTLNLSSALLEWVINGYLLSLASFMLLGGRLSDIFGHKRIFFFWDDNLHLCIFNLRCFHIRLGTDSG